MAKSIMAMMAEIQSSKQSDRIIEESKEPSEHEKIFIKLLHVSMEFGMPGIPDSVAVGGIGSVVYSLCQAQKVHKHFIDARVIIPYYEGLHKDLTNFEEICEITHRYDEQFVRSMILKKTTDEGIIQYLVKPLEIIGIQLFNDIHIPELIYSSGWNGSRFIERMSYFSSAVSEFSCTGEPLFKPDIVQGHGWALSFLGKLIREKRTGNLQEKPYTVYVAHSIHDSDGVFSSQEIPIAGKKSKAEHPVRLTQEILNEGYDHIVYVSEQLLKESILNPHYETISNFVLDAYKASRASAILNNISTEKFDPSKCLSDEFKFNLDDICSGKEKIKNYLNNGILKERGKAINLYAPMVLYVGRYSYEKGIEIFDSAIKVILKNHGTFFSMGTGDQSLIQWLIDKYQFEKSVIFFTTKEEQLAYGHLVRPTADILLTPSKLETCGLTPQEGNAAGTISVASNVGGLKNVIIPDANGALFEFDKNFEEVLQNVLNSYVELKRTGNLNTTLKLIQESAIKSFDWNSRNSKHSGSNFSYFNLYRQLGNKKEMKKRLIEQETIFTHALLTDDEETIESILKTENPMFFFPNKIGLTPSELAARMNRPDIAERINRIIYKKREKKPISEPIIYKKIRIILNICLEYKQSKLGGVGIFVTSFIEAINSNKNAYTECQVIIPHYPWHDELINENLLKKKNKYEISHLYDNRMIKSIVTKVSNDGVIQYLIKPDSNDLYESLYKSITKNEGNKIFHNISKKTVYFNSAVAAFVSKSGLRFNIIVAHGSGCALTARLLKEREKFYDVKNIQIVHAEITEQGVVTNDDPDFKCFSGIGLNFNNKTHISPLQEGITHSDKTVFVSESLLNQTINYVGYFNFNEIIREHYKSGKLISILNGINDNFNPDKLISSDKDFDKNNKISTNKFIAKQKVCKLISKALSSPETTLSEIEFFHGKNLDCNKIWTLFVGRFSEEKGIDRLEPAIEFTLENDGVFIVMGLYGERKEDVTIKELSKKYADNPNVIILHEKNYNVQKKYGHPFRLAADILAVLSHKESAGLLVFEGLLNYTFAITSNVGGLNDSVIPYKTGLKYDDLDPEPYESMRKTFAEGNRFILNLKTNEKEHYEEFLKKLHETCVQKHLFSSSDGPTKRYLDLFDSLCYFQPIKETIRHTTNNTTGSFIIPSGKSLISTGLSIYTNSGDEIELYRDKETDIKSIYLSNSLLIGRVVSSEKHHYNIEDFIVIKKQNLEGLSQKKINGIMSEFDVLHKMNYLALPNPHITDSGDIYFFIKFYKGHPLYRSYPEYKDVELPQKLIYIEQLMKFLKEMHHKNILHLDISENNVTLEERVILNKVSFNAILTNFSASKNISLKNSRVKINYFTEHSPMESLSGYASYATDIYGLGLFIFKYIFSPSEDYLLNKNPILGIRNDLNKIMISNFEISSNYSNKEFYVFSEIKKMIMSMIEINEESRLSIEYGIEKIQNLHNILIYPIQAPEFSLEEYYRIAGFRSFDMENTRILEFACENNYFGIVKIILSNQNQKNYLLCESNNLELLTKSVQYSNLDLIKLLLMNDFFNWVTVDGMIDFINQLSDTKSEKKGILGLFCVHLFSKNHGFNLNNLSHYNEEGHTPLSKLMLTDDWNGESEFLVEQLTIHGANINQRTLYDFDLFYFLINNKGIKNPSKVLLILVRNGFLIHQDHLNYGENLNYYFSLQTKVLYFIQSNKISGNKPNSLCFESEHTALTLASENADNDMIECLLTFYMQEHKEFNRSLILNHRNGLGTTPLQMALSRRHFSTAYLLIVNDADIYLKDLSGRTAIDIIKQDLSAEDSSLLLAKINNHFQQKFYSINIGNVLDKLLYYFQEKNFSAIYLSSLNNSSKLSDATRNRFLKSVIKNNPTKNEIIQLVDIGFYLHHTDEKGKSFLKWAEEEQPYLSKSLFLQEIDFLNQNGFNLYDIDQINDTGHTPLSYAVSIQNMALIQTLLRDFHADINAKNGVGNTALHLSVDTRNLNIINLLLSYGGNTTTVNNDGLSPHDLALGNGFHEVSECFESAKNNTQAKPSQMTQNENLEAKSNRMRII